MRSITRSSSKIALAVVLGATFNYDASAMTINNCSKPISMIRFGSLLGTMTYRYEGNTGPGNIMFQKTIDRVDSHKSQSREKIALIGDEKSKYRNKKSQIWGIFPVEDIYRTDFRKYRYKMDVDKLMSDLVKNKTQYFEYEEYYSASRSKKNSNFKGSIEFLGCSYVKLLGKDYETYAYKVKFINRISIKNGSNKDFDKGVTLTYFISPAHATWLRLKDETGPSLVARAFKPN